MKKVQLKRGASKLKTNIQLKRSSEAIRGGKKGLKAGKRLSSKPKTEEVKEIARMTREADRRLCQQLWADRGPYSELSKEWLGNEPNWACVHHLWGKAKYPVYRYDKENCILLTITEHANVENGHLYPEVERRKRALKIKYDV